MNLYFPMKTKLAISLVTHKPYFKPFSNLLNEKLHLFVRNWFECKERLYFFFIGVYLFLSVDHVYKVINMFE